MEFKHIIKRGIEANLPVLDEGEIAYTTDTKKYWVGSSEGNIPYLNKNEVDQALNGKATKEELETVTSQLAGRVQ
jgi:hypothetical protein